MLLEPPAPGVLHQHRAPHVAERREAPPLLRIGLEQRTEQRPRSAAVRHREQQPGGRHVAQPVLDRGPSPLGCGAVRLPAPALHVLPGRPRVVLGREALARLLEGQSLPAAEVQLAEPGVQPRRTGARRGDRSGGVAGAGQVAAQQDGGARRGEQPGDSARLLPADVVQRRIELPLDAAAGVVPGAGVPEQRDAAARRTGPGQGATDVRPTAREASRSTNGTTGQSFHSRSSA